MFGMVTFGSINTETATQQQEFTTEYKKMLTWTDDGLVSPNVTLNCINGTITINKTGNYNVTFSVSFKGTNERNYDLAVFKNGDIQSQVKTQRFFGPNLKTGDVYGAGYIAVTSTPTIIDLRAKCDVSDANVMIVENAILSCIEIIPDFTPGQDNTASNVGGEKEVFKQKTGVDLEFRTLKEGTNVTITQNSEDLEITATGNISTGTASITASTTQTQGEGPLTTTINEIAVVANTNDTVTLPTAIAFIGIIVINNGLKKLQIFPASGDNLGNGVDISTSLLSGSNIHFVTYDATNWEMV